MTTHSLGGRDEFFDPEHTRWVDDDPAAVAAAVAELISLDLDPMAIRDAAVAKVDAHRRRLLAWMRQVIESDGGEPGRWGGGWPDNLPNKLWVYSGAAGVIDAINQDRRPPDVDWITNWGALGPRGARKGGVPCKGGQGAP